MVKQRIVHLVPPLEDAGTDDAGMPEPGSFGVVLPEPPSWSSSARDEQLADILRSDCRTPAAEELAQAIGEGLGTIQFLELPDIGEMGVDHRALSIVESDPDKARLYLAAALWLGNRGSRWRIGASKHQSGEPEVISDDENLVAWAVPVDAERILVAWAEGRRVMVVRTQRSGAAVGYLFAGGPQGNAAAPPHSRR